MTLSPPLLSAFDPEISAEGGIDPLSLSATYERLAERIFPFMTVRMSRPRFVTAMAVGAAVCQDFGDDLAADGKTPAWLAFEWHVIEAFFRAGDRFRASDGGWGVRVPGVMKVRAAVDAGHRIGAGMYLKTPRIFGFTGIYRRLALGLDILDEDLHLMEGGFELLRAWEAERNLQGFLAGTGMGGDFRRELVRAVGQAMKSGSTCQTGTWSGWERIAEHLRPDGARLREQRVLADRLCRTDVRQNPHDSAATAVRSELIVALAKRGQSVASEEEARWFRSLRKTSSPALAERLDAIHAYEEVCALVLDAFNLVRHLSTRGGAEATSEDFRSFQGARDATAMVSRLPEALERLERSFGVVGFQSQAEPLLDRFGGTRTADELFARVMEHHDAGQRAKPPDGKRSWFDSCSTRGGEGVFVRARYRLPELLSHEGRYTHPYRAATASSFLRDLRKLPS
ncbi:MAG: hypothetical protein ABI779_18290 [Acidobacteriota bacterium]